MASRYLTINRTLVYCDGPQLILGEDGRKIQYLGLAIPNANLMHTFLAVQVSEEMLDDYFAEAVDLRFVFKRPRRDKYFLCNLENEKGGRLPLAETAQIDEDWLPEPGFFASSHTEQQSGVVVTQQPLTLDIGIDGRWDIQDLSQFPNKFADAYSFMHAMRPASQRGADEVLGELFERYPWRGGFSSVGFYNGLYMRIPRSQRLAVKEIQYASPGTIKITALPDIAVEIQKMVEAINSNWRKVQDAYRELHNGMSEREFLGRSHREITLDNNDQVFLERASKGLCQAIGFKYLSRVHKLAGSDWLATAKIVASFFRRVEELADFYESGKANFA